MILINADNISKSYTEKPLLNGVSLSIHEGEKIGLIGVNGTGKSTLLRIIAGAEDPDSGDVTYTNGITKSYLPQNPDYDASLTVSEQAAKYLEMLGGNTPEYVCRSMMTKLGITDFDAVMGNLSGGQRKRVALAAVLCVEPDLIILDEPTNHMDNGIIDWLEDYLTQYKGAVFMITHDRYFLDRVTSRIVEIDRGSLYSYDGNYDYYLEAKSAREESALASERKRAAMYKKELAWIRRGAQARSTKAKSHIERFEELRDSKLIIDRSEMNMDAASSRLGKKIIEIEGISKSYEGRKLIDKFSYTVLRNDRIGIIGDNGSGKSTFIKMILRLEPVDSGKINIGETVQFGYYAQEGMNFDTSMKVIDAVRNIAEYIDVGGGRHVSAMQFLQYFLFPPARQNDYIYKLSGGERSRLYLCTVLMKNPNFLILDEPTNNLDIETLQVLEEYLTDFRGCLIIVSHDRWFMDRVVDHLLVFHGEGRIEDYPGNYTQYRLSDKEREQEALRAKEAQKKAEEKEAPRRSAHKRKLSYRERQEMEKLEKEIEQLEQEQADIIKALSGGEQNAEEITQLSKRLPECEKELETKSDRWLELSMIED